MGHCAKDVGNTWDTLLDTQDIVGIVGEIWNCGNGVSIERCMDTANTNTNQDQNQKENQMKDRLFYSILEMAQNYHNAKMTGQPWTDKQQNQALKSILHDLLALYGVDLDAWLDTCNDCYSHIEDLAERYPDCQEMINDFSMLIDDMYELNKKD